MKLSTRTRYGTRLLVDLARFKGTITIKEIATRGKFSRSYLQHIITPLVNAGILGSTRGAKGGIWLVQPPDKIRLSHIIKLLEGESLLVHCTNNPEKCDMAEGCMTREIWKRLEEEIFSKLDHITLTDLAK
jgi:Rrf2 family transcriptional regulator, iron-sulfur cluster assembly transcription factor